MAKQISSTFKSSLVFRIKTFIDKLHYMFGKTLKLLGIDAFETKASALYF